MNRRKREYAAFLRRREKRWYERGQALGQAFIQLSAAAEQYGGALGRMVIAHDVMSGKIASVSIDVELPPAKEE